MAYKRYLLKRINKLRGVMIETANHYGLNHNKTIDVSQELDFLLIKYQLIKNIDC